MLEAVKSDVDVAPLRLRTALHGLAWIYGLTILSCAIVNLIVKLYPIGPWTGSAINKFFWLDNVTWQIFAAWWACFFVVCSFWPFERIADPVMRGIAVVVASWALGWLSAKAIFATSLGASWIFPLVGTTWFFLAFFCFNGGNWIVEGLTPARQFFLLLILMAGFTYVITHSTMRWIPAWWFPFNLVGAATGTLAYLTRGMRQPGKAVAQMSLLFLVAGGCIWISEALGVWDPKAAQISSYWLMGELTPDNSWLVFFMIATSVNYAFPIMLNNWPFTRMRMPWGGIAACCFYLVLDVVLTKLALASVGSVFSSKESLLTYSYMGVNWSLVMPLVFGFGFDKEYLWRGQRSAGNWDDIP